MSTQPNGDNGNLVPSSRRDLATVAPTNPLVSRGLGDLSILDSLPKNEDLIQRFPTVPPRLMPLDRANAIRREVRTRWEQRHPAKKEPSAGHLVANTLGMKFAWCPPGTFLMGSPESESERRDDETQHRVTLCKGFYLGVHPVTQAQWRSVMGSTPSHFDSDQMSIHDQWDALMGMGSTPSHFEGDHLPVEQVSWDALRTKDLEIDRLCDHLPVEQVSWDDCQEFCKKLGQKDGKRYRLPTEAEWEYACRAGTTTPFHFGENITTDQVNYNGNNPYNNGPKGKYRENPTAVGSLPPNAWGLYDMHGNVYESCQDWYGPYPAFDVVDPQGDGSGELRVLRGGSWCNFARSCRSAIRDRYSPGYLGDYVGCRVVLCLD
jgi:formylglycine-generating enzyme required for sulfatase activity